MTSPIAPSTIPAAPSLAGEMLISGPVKMLKTSSYKYAAVQKEINPSLWTSIVKIAGKFFNFIANLFAKAKKEDPIKAERHIDIELDGKVAKRDQVWAQKALAKEIEDAKHDVAASIKANKNNIVDARAHVVSMNQPSQPWYAKVSSFVSAYLPG